MLKVNIYAGPLSNTSIYSRIAWVDIAYENLAFLANYKVVLFLNGIGALEQASIFNYPRWSGSLWDLVLRAILVSLNQGTAHADSTLPPEEFPTRNLAFATALSATITHYPGTSRPEVRQLGTCEILMGKKGVYTARFSEHAGPDRTTLPYQYGPAEMNPAIHLAHAICAGFGKDAYTLPEKPIFMNPPEIELGGEQYFNLLVQNEPLATGIESWLRFKGVLPHPSSNATSELYPIRHYWEFLNTCI